MCHYTPRALIIEEEAHDLVIIGSILQSLGFEFKRDTTGKAAIQQAMRLRPDVIIIDMDLPLANPFDILDALQEDSRLALIPVIAMGDNTIVHLLNGIDSPQVVARLCKPLPRQDLSALLTELLETGQINTVGD